MTTPAPQPSSSKRRTTWLIVLAVVLPVVGVVLLVVGAYTFIAFGPGESADDSLALVESAPVPRGAVETERSAVDGTVSIGPLVRVAYRLDDQVPLEQACATLIDQLRAEEWMLATFGQDSVPVTGDAATACRGVADDTLVLDATRDDNELVLGIVIGKDRSGKGSLAYSADGT